MALMVNHKRTTGPSKTGLPESLEKRRRDIDGRTPNGSTFLAQTLRIRHQQSKIGAKTEKIAINIVGAKISNRLLSKQ
jgi:hypothetical protein